MNGNYGPRPGNAYEAIMNHIRRGEYARKMVTNIPAASEQEKSSDSEQEQDHGLVRFMVCNYASVIGRILRVMSCISFLSLGFFYSNFG